MRRIVIGGKGWMAVRAAKLLASLSSIGTIDTSVEIVRNRDDAGAYSWLPSLVAAASEKGWLIHERVEEASLGRSDIFLSLEHDRIVNCSRLGDAQAYNVHFSNLPKYRGSLTSVWPILSGEQVAGVTLHVLTQEVDAGPVVAARVFELPPFFSAYDLYRAYHSHGFDLLKDNLEPLLKGSFVAVPQDESSASEFMRNSIDFSACDITEFDLDSERVRDRCRAFIFPPFQYPRFRGRQVNSCYSIQWGDPAGQPGTVLSEDRDQAIVACRSGMICFEFVAVDADN